jgi:hypothetical protein
VYVLKALIDILLTEVEDRDLKCPVLNNKLHKASSIPNKIRVVAVDV